MKVLLCTLAQDVSWYEQLRQQLLEAGIEIFLLRESESLIDSVLVRLPEGEHRFQVVLIDARMRIFYAGFRKQIDDLQRAGKIPIVGVFPAERLGFDEWSGEATVNGFLEEDGFNPDEWRSILKETIENFKVRVK